MADYRHGTVLEAARCISDNRYLFRTSPTVENSDIIEDDGERARWRERREKLRARKASRNDVEGWTKREGWRGDSGVMSGQARARCEKGSVVSASRFRPVIGSDSVLTLNAREPPVHSRAAREDRGSARGRILGMAAAAPPSSQPPVLSSIIYDRA